MKFVPVMRRATVWLAAAVAVFAVSIWAFGGNADASDKANKKDGAKKAQSYDAMVNVPAGEFIFGEGDSQKKITLGAFSIDKYEVTNARFGKFKPEHGFAPEKANHPVAEISWFEAEAYCKSQGKRLPTEQEWEKAARGTDGRTYPWGNGEEELEKCANVSEVGVGEPTAVGQFEDGKSPYGAMDMGGNVWEWTASYHPDDQRYVVLRGGSYFEDCSFSKTTSRLRSIPDDRKEYVGVRCVKDVK